MAQKEIEAPQNETAKEEQDYLKRRRLVSIISFVIFIALFVGLTIAIGKPLVELAQTPEKFRDWIDSQGFWGQLTFIGIQVLQVIIALIPGEVIEIGSGYAFGAWEGTLLCMVGVAIGSAIIFLLTRLFGTKLVEAFISREKISQMRFIKDEKKLNFLIFLLFFIPGTPKDLLTYFVGLTPMKLPTFLIISSIARIPSIVTSTFGGHALGEQNYTLAIVVFVATGVISLAGMLVYNRIMKHRAQKANHAEEKSNSSPAE